MSTSRNLPSKHRQGITLQIVKDLVKMFDCQMTGSGSHVTVWYDSTHTERINLNTATAQEVKKLLEELSGKKTADLWQRGGGVV